VNKIILAIAATIFLLGVLLRILFAFFFPDRFAEGARKVLFLEKREQNLFRTGKKSSDTKRNRHADFPTGQVAPENKCVRKEWP